MLAQTTDSAASNNYLACELERMFFDDSTNPLYWNSQVNHIRCFCHKLALAVKHGLDKLKLKSGHVKPTTQPDIRMPIPTTQINRPVPENLTGKDAESSESETEIDRKGLERVEVEDSEDDLPADDVVTRPTWGLVTSGVKKASDLIHFHHLFSYLTMFLITTLHSD